MAGWTRDELGRIGGAEEIEVRARRADGTLRQAVTIWIARAGDSLYVRSVRGRDGGWYRAIQATRRGQVSGGGVEKDVDFVSAGEAVQKDVDAAYRAKYRRYAGRILNSVLTPESRSTTLEVVPRS